MIYRKYNGLIFNFNIFSVNKLDLVRAIKIILSSYQLKKKMKKNLEFFRKPSVFDKINSYFVVIYSKMNNRKSLKFLPNIYNVLVYFTFFELCKNMYFQIFF